MAIEEGFVHYQSDKSGQEDYLRPSDPRTSNYIEIVRIDASKNTIKRTLTKEEYKEYQTLAGKQDNEFNEFMSATKAGK